ncbi:GDSL-type esterase/lipase family protein [bacterium]|nr:GDSL-type esterase/lipase family protein [bacterium]
MKVRIHPLLSMTTALASLTMVGLSEPGVPSSKPKAPDPAVSITISEPGFEANGNWKLAQTGAGVDGLFDNDVLPNYIKAGLIDTKPDLGTRIAYNNGPQHNLYQVLEATVAANTTYKLSIFAIDSTASNPFPGGELRLGYASANPKPKDDFGWNLLTPAKTDHLVPFNDHENSPENLTDGAVTWNYTFTTDATPVGLGRKLRIEILGGGKAQALFDNVRLESRVATPEEISAAANAVKPAPIVVMFGDSTTDGGMAPAVQKELHKLIASERRRPKVINAGKGGDYAAGALKRLEKDVLAHEPDVVTISFGLNDTGLRKPEKYLDSLKKMIRSFEDAGIQILLMTSTPFNNETHGWGTKFEKDGGLDEYLNKEYCDRMRTLADRQEIPLCDLHAIFTAEIQKDPGQINKIISGDGVHLTAEGYHLISKHVAPNIIKLLNAKSAQPAVRKQ